MISKNERLITFYESLECKLNILTCCCWGWNIQKFMIHGKVFNILLSDFMIWKVILVSYHQNADIRFTKLSDFFNPLFDVFKCNIFSQIKDNDCTNSSSIVSWRKCSEFLLSSSIPDLIFDPILPHFDSFRSEFNTNSWFRIKTELIINKSWEYLCFSNIGVTNNNSFEQKVVILLYRHLDFNK